MLKAHANSIIVYNLFHGMILSTLTWYVLRPLETHSLCVRIQ